MISRLFALVFVALALGGCGEPPYTNVDNAGLKNLIAQGVPVYDIRRPEEWKQTGVVAGSRLLTWVDGGGRPNPHFLPEISAAVDKNAPVVLICRTGNRTDQLARELVEKHGFSKVYNVRDGIVRWVAENNPVARP